MNEQEISPASVDELVGDVNIRWERKHNRVMFSFNPKNRTLDTIYNSILSWLQQTEAFDQQIQEYREVSNSRRAITLGTIAQIRIHDRRNLVFMKENLIEVTLATTHGNWWGDDPRLEILANNLGIYLSKLLESQSSED